MLSIRTLFSVNAYNVTLTGVAFLFLFTASQTASLASQNVLEAAAREGNGAASVGIGYISLALLYASLAICNWFAPVIVLLLGHKYAMFAGALSYVLFVAAFMEPQAWSLYSASLLNGLGAAVLWTAQGAFITACSDETNSNRHFSAFWTLFQMCQLVGGLYVYISLSGISEITRSMRHQLFGGLIVCGSLGALMFFGLRDPAIKTRVVRQSELPSSSSSSSSTADQSDTVDLVTIPLLNKRSGIREQFAVSIHTFCQTNPDRCSQPRPVVCAHVGTLVMASRSPKIFLN